MRKKYISLLAVLGAVLLPFGFSLSASAATPAATAVTGVITNHGNPVGGASVTVTCNGHVATDTTDNSGSYLVYFHAGDCPNGTTVKVSAQKGGMSGSSSGTVEGKTTKLNLAIVNVSIPEYGVIGAVAAGGAGLGAIAYTRRNRKQSDTV